MDYADFFDESVQMLCVAGLDGHFHFVNPAFVEALGLSEEEVLATPYLELVHPDDVPATRDELEKLARGQITTDFECRFRRGDGDYILLSWFARAKPDGRIYAAARDVTRFRELLDSERRYRELYEEAPDMFVSVDPSSRRIVACNATTCETLGYTRDELMGQPVGKLYHPDSVERIPAIFGEFRRAGRAEAEVTLALKDGSPLPASLRVSAIRDERGRIRYSASVLRDITQKKVQEAEIERLQAQLRERAERSEDRMAAILGALPDLVVEIRLDGGIEGVHIHPEVEGAEAVAFVGRNLADVLPPDVVPRALEMMRDCVEEDEPRVLEFRMPWAGAVRDYLCRLSPTHYGTVVGVMRDVTRERQALRDLEEQALELARSNQALEQFATIASHDLQEPLRTVAEYTRMVQEDHGEDLSEEAERAISLAIAGADRMKSLVQDLLEYARAGAEAGMEDVHCDEVLDEALELLGSAVSHAGATVRREPLPVVRGNRNRLTQLFLNLLGNAVKFGGAEPVVVEMGARDEGTHWSFFVRDNGIGFDAAEAEAIFRPFHRLHPATRFAGNGIGLALCRRIVEHHGGTIRADSEPGRGTTLTFTIPR